MMLRSHGTFKMPAEPWLVSLVLLVGCGGLGVFWGLFWQVLEMLDWSQSTMEDKVPMAWRMYHEFIIRWLALRGVMWGNHRHRPDRLASDDSDCSSSRWVHWKSACSAYVKTTCSKLRVLLVGPRRHENDLMRASTLAWFLIIEISSTSSCHHFMLLELGQFVCTERPLQIRLG